MKYKYILFSCLVICMGLSPSLHAQEETNCNPLEGLPVAGGELIFNYGSTTNAFSNSKKSDLIYGQPLVGTIQNQDLTSEFGFWSLLRMPPQAPNVIATQGDFPDRVLIEWSEDPLGPSSSDGFIVTRDGAFLTRIDPDIFQFIDFNVQAGENYEYAVKGVNQFGNGVNGFSVGFVNPNGLVTGKITTSNGNPVPGATVTLDPTIGRSLQFDGVDDYICVSHHDTLLTDMFTVSTWVKIGDTHDSYGIIDLGSDLNKNFWMHTTPSGMDKGVVVGVGDGTMGHEITYEFVDENPEDGTDQRNDWHHVAMVYGGGALILYVDGNFISSIQADIEREATLFSIGSDRANTSYFKGKLDDLRVYNRLLTQTEIITTKDITVSKATDALVAYWKFDEGLGSKVFDLTHTGLDGLLGGVDQLSRRPAFSADTPDIKNGAITDATGFYAIEGINYSEEQAFFANPEKIFYDNYSLEFNAAYQSCATLTNFDLPDTSHIELTIHPFELNRKQSILSKMQGGTAGFNLYIENAMFHLNINGESQVLGAAAAEFHHIALSLNGTTGDVTYYKNGNLETTLTYADLTGTWNDEVWQLGAKSVATPSEYYTGLIDEVAFYQDSLLTLAEVQLHAASFGNGGTDVGHGSLASYFDLNEGDGTELMDIAAANTGLGEVKNATFSIIAFRQGETPHEFEPNARFININPSATAVSNIDFTDISTVAIAGVVRYSNTFCYADSVEILVNGASYFPPIFTDENGRFVGDFEPGSTIQLTPVFADHEFFPGFFEMRKINRPVAGVLFQDLTKREVVGQVFGGLCRKSIIQADMDGNPQAIVKVKAESLGTTCYEQILQLQTVDGKYKLKNLPPIPMAIKLIEHSNNVIYDYFQIQGGQEVDLREIEKDTVDFMYISPPNVEIGEIESGIIGNECNNLPAPIIKDSQEFSTPRSYANNIKVYQNYDGGRCYLENFDVTINNNIEELEQKDTSIIDTTVFRYEWMANNPNMLPPHTKSMQITVDVNGATATDTYEVIVLGERQLPGTISTSGPSEVFGIVYDPPGDEASATLTKGTQTCVTWEDVNANSENASTDIAFKLGSKVAIATGVGVSKITTFEADNTTTLSGSFEISHTNSNEAEFCFETVKEISTSDGDDIWGSYADVYFGAAMNFKIGARDILDYDFDNCEYTFNQILTIAPDGFATDFVFSEWQILTEVIPQLDSIIINPSTTVIEYNRAVTDRQKWLSEIVNKRQRQKTAEYTRNITYDAAASYTETVTSELTGSNTFTTTIGGGAGIENEHGWDTDGFGVDWTIQASWEHEHETTEGVSISNSIETSFTLADDDLNDFYSVGIADEYPNISFSDLEDLEDAIDDLEYGISGQYIFDNQIADTDYEISKLNQAPFSHAPMFKIVGGESMCPWIPGTRNREEVSIQVDQNVAINVPSNAPAVFRVTLGSIGPNGVDGLVYELGVDEGGNPDGAIIKVDGAPIINPLEFQFIGNSTVQKTITVEYPNTGQFDFEDLGLYFASVCQIEHSESVGFDAGDGGFLIYDDYQATAAANGEKEIYSRFYLPLELDVHFIEPCSPIDIGFPMQNHVINPGEEILNVTLNEYVNTDPDLELVRLQYRPIPGDGAWINILELPVAEFANDPVFKVVQWDMTDLRDGDYELRAITQCYDVSLNPGISEVILVTKSTLPPIVLGEPQPADGILSPGDEISITFNKDIRCNEIFQADGIGTNINNNNLGLYDATNGQLIDAIITCRDNKINIVPNIQDVYIENRTLRVQVEDIKDLNGNELEEPVIWEFYVNKSNLYWVEGDITDVKEEGDTKIITRKIKNQSGQITNWNLDNIPDWVSVSPTSGQLTPGDFQTVTFEFEEDMITNFYNTTIDLVASDGIEPLNIDFRVVCKGPEWTLDPTQYTYTMNMTLQLDIEGDLSEDNMDRVAAFITNADTGLEELRGWAYVQYEPSITPTPTIENPSPEPGTYFAFLTLYSNQYSGEDIKLKIWDVSDCTLYGQVLEDFTYEADGIIGSPLEPQVVHTVNLISRTIPIHRGWNWISYNVDLPDASINSALESLTQPENSLIKNQTDFAVHSVDNGGFVGNMPELTHRTMYQYRSEAIDSLVLTGRPIDPDTVPIDILAGWNWIGFLPQQGMAVGDALTSLAPLNGDIVKSQIAFAQYVAGTGWIGNLNFMSSPNGYLLKISNDGTLNYPRSFTGPAIVETRNSYESYWNIQPELYQYTMNMIGVVKDETNLLEDGDEVAAFVNGEIRGLGEVVYIEGSNSYLIFLTAYANEENETLDFKFYDRSRDAEIDLMETFSFSANAIYGSVDAPEIWTPMGVSSTSHLANGETFEVYPNPANERVYLRFNNDIAERIVVRITDALGREIERMETQAAVGELTLEWQPQDLSEGLYFITLDRADSSLTRKVRITK